ncbi:MAG: quinolinate synthase NadA [Calditrichaeota bacterium]|nr:quinolinate synthase NadA [Calditrichota bacterium]
MFDAKELYAKLSRADAGFYTLDTCHTIAAKLDRIAELKQRRNAVILAHNYQRPEIFEIADYIGDSLGLSLQAAEVKTAEAIVFCGVHFMAETAKVVNPGRKVIHPNRQAGCSLADMADEVDLAVRIKDLRRQFDDLGIVCYVNTTAAVKALSDACCTSANAIEVIAAMPNRNILFLPDCNLGRYAAQRLPEKNVILWDGFCAVHQEIEPASVEAIRAAYPGLKVLAHPECRDDVVRLADAALSTAGMVKYAQNSPAQMFLAVTECGLSDLLAIQVPNKQFFRACKICRFMKMITLDDVISSLENLQPEIVLDEGVRKGAERSIRRMFELTVKEKIPPTLLNEID